MVIDAFENYFIASIIHVFLYSLYKRRFVVINKTSWDVACLASLILSLCSSKLL